jgi:hypothetical protein
MERTPDAIADDRFVRSLRGNRCHRPPDKELAMYARIVTFRLDGLPPAAYEAHAAAVAPAFTTWPGLLAKVWIADAHTRTYGGIYLFADRASADRSRETDVFRAMAANAAFADLTVREFDVLDEPTSTTAKALAAASAGSNDG